jgi:hypothetical protein
MRFLLSVAFFLALRVPAAEPPTRVYENHLRQMENPRPILADYTEFFEPIEEEARFEAPPIVTDDGADMHVRAWRFSYNARGIIEMPNHLRSKETAVIMVHPWAIDDAWGWKSPQPNGVADFCTPTKNAVAARHTRQIIDPFLKRLRGAAALVMYSLPDPLMGCGREFIDRLPRRRPTPSGLPGRRRCARSLPAILTKGKRYRGRSP